MNDYRCAGETKIVLDEYVQFDPLQEAKKLKKETHKKRIGEAMFSLGYKVCQTIFSIVKKYILQIISIHLVLIVIVALYSHSKWLPIQRFTHFHFLVDRSIRRRILSVSCYLKIFFSRSNLN